MTKLYSIEQLNAEHNDKEVGTLYREHIKFSKESKRKFTPVYHDEQVPIETRYKQTEVGFAKTPRWTGGIVNDKWIQKVGAQLSVFKGGDGVEIQKTGEIESGGKYWRSSKDWSAHMLGRPAPQTIFDKEETDEFDWMWRVFDNDHHFSNNGRKISIDWGSGWGSVLGSLPIKNILEEDLKLSDFEFYSSSDEENEALLNGEWREVVEAHLKYFKDIVPDIMKRHTDKLTVDEAVAVAYLAICDFSKKISDNKEELNARFRTSAYSWAKWYYQEALAMKDVINTKASVQKQKDRRTLNNLVSELKGELFREPTIDEIMNRSGFGDKRIESTYRLFDFNISKYRPMNDEEMLYTVMNEHLTERQASIIEMNFGLNGTKWTTDDIADELGCSVRTIKYDKDKALKIIKEELSFKYENKG